MEAKINIAEILKDKPQGIRLYSPIFGECAFCYIREDTDDICVKKHNGEKAYFNSYGLYCTLGEVMLFPSREMRDWSKFAWEKGDVLVHKDGTVHIIFEGFEDDTYRTFKGKYYLWKDNGYIDQFDEYQCYMQTSIFIKANDDDTQTYINTIEERLGGKLNRETLEVEKTQPEFKDGDIITIKPCIGGKLIYLFKAEDEEKYYGRAFLNGNITIVYENNYCQKDFCTARLSTEEEQKQLFDGLAKKHVYWDCEHKEIIDMNVKVDLKPFDRVLVWCGKWIPDVFGYRNDDGQFICIGGGGFDKVIPYEGNEHLLGTTKDVEG